MLSRRAVACGALVLGLLAPIVPRVVLAMLDAEEAERFFGWLGRAFSPRELGDWIWALSPFLALAALAMALLHDRVDATTRSARSRALWASVLIAFGLGVYLCAPVSGQGMNVYLGEALFPFVAVPAVGIAYPLAARLLRKREADPR